MSKYKLKETFKRIALKYSETDIVAESLADAMNGAIGKTVHNINIGDNQFRSFEEMDYLDVLLFVGYLTSKRFRDNEISNDGFATSLTEEIVKLTGQKVIKPLL